MTLQEQLCEKMRVEQSAYCLWLTAQPPEEILHHAYEYSVREDIILATEEMNLTPAQVRALLKSPAPLADVYKDFPSWKPIMKALRHEVYICSDIETDAAEVQEKLRQAELAAQEERNEVKQDEQRRRSSRSDGAGSLTGYRSSH